MVRLGNGGLKVRGLGNRVREFGLGNLGVREFGNMSSGYGFRVSR